MTDEDIKKPDTEQVKESVSIVDEARAIRDDIVKQREDLKKENDRKEKLHAEELLSSTAGKRVDVPLVSKEDAKKAGAKEFFKGTALEDAIDKL